MTVKVNFGRYRHQDTAGYVITAEDGGTTSAVMIAMDADGRVSAARANWAGELEADPQWIALESREPGQWPYSLMTGTPSIALLDVLGIPHVERDVIAPKLFALAADQAAKELPRLNVEALKAMASSPDKTLSTYDFYAVEGERGLYRQQAAKSFPVFADLFNANLSTKMAIDRKKPLNEILIPVISGMTDVPVGNALLKRFAQAPALPEGMRLGPILTFASRVQPDWYPKSAEEWTAFYTIAYALLEDLAVPPESLGPLLAGSGGKWVQLVERALVKAHPDPNDPAHADPMEYLRGAALNARDTLECFTDMVVLPIVSFKQDADDVYLNVAIRKGASSWAWDMLYEGRNLPDLLDVSRRFHQERAGMMEMSAAARLAQAKSQIKEGGWPGLTAPVRAPNGYWLVPLQTTPELGEEGKRMSHCVGGYTSSAKGCTSHIVSVRTIHEDGRSTSHSTCEFAGITAAVPTLNIRQHKSHGNGRPDAPFQDAIAWYKREIEAGRLKTNWELIRAFLDNTLVSTDQVERICGYDWRDYDSLNQAVRPWAAFVTKAYRTKNLDMLMDSEQAQSIIGGMTPAFLSAHSM
jgi:hypothetical protein|nr:PcfJ domain-containing protein [Neorhizobium tomejilense]